MRNIKQIPTKNIYKIGLWSESGVVSRVEARVSNSQTGGLGGFGGSCFPPKMGGLCNFLGGNFKISKTGGFFEKIKKILVKSQVSKLSIPAILVFR